MTPRLCACLVSLLAMGVVVGTANAERVRYHFAPADLNGTTVQTPAGNGNAVGERVSYFGVGNAPYFCGKRPTYLVTFWHPYSGKNVTVPLALPEDTPRIEHGPNRITFNYTTYWVDVMFLPD